MALRDKKFVRTKITKSNEPLVTVTGASFHFNSHFIKEADLRKSTRVSVFVDETDFKVGFEFHSNETDKNTFSLIIRPQGGGASIKAQEIIFNTPFLKKINGFSNPADKRFPIAFDKFERLYTVNLSPAFEISANDRLEISHDLKGIYRYLDGETVVYIGRGRIRSRANSPERKDWKFNKIQYSILEDEDKQVEWEAYWIRRHKEDHQGELPFYNKIAGQG